MPMLGIMASQISGHLAGPVFLSISNTSGTKAQTSVDGITWTARTLPSTASWGFPAYGNGLYMAANGTTTYATSTNAITWTSRSATYALNGIAYGNSKWVAVTSDGSTNAQTSTDGITWTSRTIGAGNRYAPLVYGASGFATPLYDSANMQTSSDGITWTNRSLANANYWAAMNYDNGVYFAAQNGDSSYAYSTNNTSYTGGTWSALYYRQGAYGASTWVIVYLSNNTCLSSTNGTTSWTTRTLPSSGNWTGCAYGNGVFVATKSGSDGAATSTDGTTWTARTMSSTSNWSYMVYA